MGLYLIAYIAAGVAFIYALIHIILLIILIKGKDISDRVLRIAAPIQKLISGSKKMALLPIKAGLYIKIGIGIALGILLIVVGISLSMLEDQVRSALAFQTIFSKDSTCECYALCTGNPEDDLKTSYELLFGYEAYDKFLSCVPSDENTGLSVSDYDTVRDKSYFMKNHITTEMLECYREAIEERPDFRDDGVNRVKLSDSELKADLVKLLSDYKVNGKNPHCSCAERTKVLLKRKCLGGKHFGSEWSWQRVEEEIYDWITGGSDGVGGGGSPAGSATGAYAVQLDDGSYYWYHQAVGCGCTYCGDWSDATFGATGYHKMGKSGCAIYSLAMIASNLSGREITPSVVLSDLGCSPTMTNSGKQWNTSSSSAFSSSVYEGRAIVRDKAASIIASKYGLHVKAIGSNASEIDEILNKGGYVWGSWHGEFEWYNGEGHFMAIRKMSGDKYYCFTSCSNRNRYGGGKNGAIATMNAGSAKSTVISHLNAGQLYGFWVDQPANSGGAGGAGGDYKPPSSGSSSGGGKGVKTVNGWLELYSGPTVKGSYLNTPIPSSYSPGKWAMGEGSNNKGSKYCRESYSDSALVRTSSGTGYTNSSGRYWVAVGPAVTNKQFKCNTSGGTVTPSHMALPKLFDVVIKEKSTDKTYYIPCVAGDVKAHTYPTGIVQTGAHVFTGVDEYNGAHNDSSIVEFCGVSPGKGSALNNEYEIVDILVYQ